MSKLIKSSDQGNKMLKNVESRSKIKENKIEIMHFDAHPIMQSVVVDKIDKITTKGEIKSSKMEDCKLISRNKAFHQELSSGNVLIKSSNKITTSMVQSRIKVFEQSSNEESKSMNSKIFEESGKVKSSERRNVNIDQPSIIKLSGNRIVISDHKSIKLSGVKSGEQSGIKSIQSNVKPSRVQLSSSKTQEDEDRSRNKRNKSEQLGIKSIQRTIQSTKELSSNKTREDEVSKNSKNPKSDNPEGNNINTVKPRTVNDTIKKFMTVSREGQELKTQDKNPSNKTRTRRKTVHDKITKTMTRRPRQQGVLGTPGKKTQKNKFKGQEQERLTEARILSERITRWIKTDKITSENTVKIEDNNQTVNCEEEKITDDNKKDMNLTVEADDNRKEDFDKKLNHRTLDDRKVEDKDSDVADEAAGQIGLTDCGGALAGVEGAGPAGHVDWVYLDPN